MDLVLEVWEEFLLLQPKIKWLLCKRTLNVSLSQSPRLPSPCSLQHQRKGMDINPFLPTFLSCLSNPLFLWRYISDNKKDWEKGVLHLVYASWTAVFFSFFMIDFLASSLCSLNSCSENMEFPSYTGILGIFGSKHIGRGLHHLVRLLRYHCLHQITACYCWLHHGNFLKHVKVRK